MNKQHRGLLLGLAVVGIVAALFYHEVDNSLSPEDKQYIVKYLTEVKPLPEQIAYEDELTFIRSVQHAVLHVAPEQLGIPFGHKREPKDLYEAKTGACFDRSRTIEKILRHSGFNLRHAFILSTEHAGSAVKALLTSRTQSHAVTEVATKQGWLIVDSNAPWISLDVEGRPISIETIRSRMSRAGSLRWEKEPPSDIYLQPFTVVYGLYARHGRFYPPYDFIPDVNYGELLSNIL